MWNADRYLEEMTESTWRTVTSTVTHEGLVVMHHAPDNLLIQAQTCLSTESKDRAVLAQNHVIQRRSAFSLVQWTFNKTQAPS